MSTTTTSSQITNTATAPLQINDLFWTLQGEGQWTGRRALFIRLPFCNYDCPWCDTEYNSFKKVSEEDFNAFCQQEPARFAVITGGEPMAHKDLKRIIMLLKQQGFYIACETNGSLPIPQEIDFPTVSPKRFTQKKYPEFFIHKDAFQKAKEFKYVVDDNFDFSLLDRHKNQNLPERSKGPPPLTTATAVIPNPSLPLSNPDTTFLRAPPEGPPAETLQATPQDSSVRLSLTPEYSSMQKQLPRILKYIQQNPEWQLNLQTHKWIEIP